jgi:hypothetical protein
VTVENDLDTGDNTGDNLLSMTLRLRNQMDVETWLIYNGIDAYDEGFVQIRQQSNGQVLLEEEFYSIQTVFLGRCLKEQDLRTLFPLARDLAERCCTAGSEDVVEVSDDEIIPVVTISDDDSLFPRLSQSRKGKKRAPISRPAASQYIISNGHLEKFENLVQRLETVASNQINRIQSDKTGDGAMYSRLPPEPGRANLDARPVLRLGGAYNDVDDGGATGGRVVPSRLSFSEVRSNRIFITTHTHLTMFAAARACAISDPLA